MEFLLKCTSSEAIRPEEKCLFLRPDEAKKSVFWLDLPLNTNEHQKDNESIASISAPAEAWITRKVSTPEGTSDNETIQPEDKMFAWGGMQITSNARQIEIYFTLAPKAGAPSPSTAPAETYLTTIKGIPASMSTDTTNAPHSSNMFKALCAVPGGPRPVVSVRLKFLSLQPNGQSTTFSLASLKWTARVPPRSMEQSNMAATNASASSMAAAWMSHMHGDIPRPDAHGMSSAAPAAGLGQIPSRVGSLFPQSLPTHQQPPQQHQNSALTREDVGSAMAGMSFTLRATEERIMGELEKVTANNQHLQNIVNLLTQQISQQALLLHQQTNVMQQQHAQILAQTKAIQALENQQQEMGDALVDRMQSLCSSVMTEIQGRCHPHQATTELPHNKAMLAVVSAKDNCSDTRKILDEDGSLWRHYATMKM